MIVEFSDEAERDLEEIGDYIAIDNPARAVSFVRDLREKCLGLADLPLGFPAVPRYEALGIRRRSHGRYAIFYRLTASAIIVLHIVHGARNDETLLWPG
jgi:toxin ParE1/3/4